MSMYFAYALSGFGGLLVEIFSYFLFYPTIFSAAFYLLWFFSFAKKETVSSGGQVWQVFKKHGDWRAVKNRCRSQRFVVGFFISTCYHVGIFVWWFIFGLSTALSFAFAPILLALAGGIVAYFLFGVSLSVFVAKSLLIGGAVFNGIRAYKTYDQLRGEALLKKGWTRIGEVSATSENDAIKSYTDILELEIIADVAVAKSLEDSGLVSQIVSNEKGGDRWRFGYRLDAVDNLISWLLSKGDTVNVLAPAQLRKDMAERIIKMKAIYSDV